MQRGIETLSQWLADWRQRSRYREVANVCVPLVMGTAATTVMEFTDRVFLANYSLETVYFKILCMGSVFHISVHALCAFFTGRGETRPVMVVSFLGMAFNIPLDYFLINGIWIFPELGIAGAAIATVSSWALMALLFSLLIFTETNEKDYAVTSSRRLDTGMLMRLMKYGLPGSMQFCLDVFAFAFFIFMVGRIGTLELAATSIVLSISSIAFMPAMGFSQGISTLVGQALGRKRPDEARYATLSAIHFLLLYTLLVDLLFIFAPEKALSLFMLHSQAGGEAAAIMELGQRLLNIVAVYLFMDALYMSFVGVLKGAGDTRFVMWSIGGAGLCFMLGPLYVGIHFLQMGVVYAWICVLAFITSLFLLSFYRYRQGKWKHMLVTGIPPGSPPSQQKDRS